MSTVDDSGLAASEHKPEPMTEAGCEGKVSRSVSWTDQRSGFAELRARLATMREDAIKQGRYHEKHQNTEIACDYVGQAWAFTRVVWQIDAIEADAKNACTRK